MEQFARITRMVGSSWIECLQNKKVAVFGLGGVGGILIAQEAFSYYGQVAFDICVFQRMISF